MDWAERYVGLPYQWGGYTRSGVFCWGLVWMIQREVFGRELPAYPHSDSKEFRSAVSGLGAKPIPMEQAEGGDVLMMREAVADRGARHIGVFVDRANVLHIEEGAGSLIERVNTQRFQWRPIQAYRLPTPSA